MSEWRIALVAEGLTDFIAIEAKLREKSSDIIYVVKGFFIVIEAALRAGWAGSGGGYTNGAKECRTAFNVRI
jgi:hypothetical protein